MYIKILFLLEAGRDPVPLSTGMQFLSEAEIVITW